MSKTTDNLERDVESTRAELDRTLDELRAKASVENLTDEAMDYLRKGGGLDIATAVWRQAREHPLPLVTIASGLVWLAASQGRNDRDSTRLRMPRQPASGGPAEDFGSHSPFGGDPVTNRERHRSDGSRRRQAQTMANRYGRQAQGFVESNPMMAIAAGFALGIAAGAVAMRSVSGSGEEEEEWMREPWEAEPPYAAGLDDADPYGGRPLHDPLAANDPADPVRSGAASPGAATGEVRPGRDAVDEALDESFPASDPPAYTSGRAAGDGTKS